MHRGRPDGTPWEDGTFKLTLDFTEEYPNKAPLVKFTTKMFHRKRALWPCARLPLYHTLPAMLYVLCDCAGACPVPLCVTLSIACLLYTSPSPRDS